MLEALAALWWAGDRAADARQAEREVQCALTLVRRLEPGGVSDVESLEHSARAEAQLLAQAPFAPGLMRAMAGVYESEAARFLGAFGLLDVRREVAEARAQGRLLASQASAVEAGLRAALALQSLAQEEGITRGCSSNADAPPRPTALCLERPSLQAQLPVLARALWCLTLLDAEGTLRRVCRRVLRDSSAHMAERARRARALQVLAHIFREAAEARSDEADTCVPGEDGPFLCRHVQETAARLAAAAGARNEEHFTPDGH